MNREKEKRGGRKKRRGKNELVVVGIGASAGGLEALQSSNEELETSNEELQSTNEELTTVNQELQVKSAELFEANADLENILAQIEFPLIMIDKELRLRRFNEAAGDTFELTGDDVGASVTTTPLPGRVGLPDFRAGLKAVIDRSDRIDHEVKIGHRIYAFRAHPYRTKGRNSPSGAMLSFIDKTEITRAEREKATIGAISQLFLRNIPLKRVYQKLTEILAERFAVPVAAVTRLDREGGDLVAQGDVGLTAPLESEGPMRIPLEGTIAGRSVQERQPIFETRVKDREIYKDSRLRRLGVQTALAVPLILEGESIGAIGLADYEDRPDLESALDTLGVIATHLAHEIDRQETARDLKKNRHYMEQVADAVPMVLYVYDLAERRNLYINRQVHHMLGHTREAIQKMGQEMLPTLLHPDDREEVEAHLERLRKASDDDLLEVEYRVSHSEGGWRWLRVGELIFRRDFEGTPREILGTGRDITRQKALENRLEHSETLYRTVLEDLPDMVCRFTEDRRLTVVNRAYARSFGKTPESLVGRKFTLSVLDEDREKLDACLSGLSREVPTCDIELRVRMENDEIRYQQWIFRAFFDDQGRLTEFQGTARDVTGLKEAEKQRAELREKELLLREVHHRVKNNLQMIISMLRLQSDGIPDETVQAMLGDNVNRIASMSLIHEKLYRAESLESVDLAGYVDELVKDLFTSYRSTRQAIRLETDIKSVAVSIDTAIPCGLVVNELISNAIKHGFNNGKRGLIRVSLGPSDNGDIRLTIADNGDGLPAGFEIDTTDSLGLKLVRGLVEEQLEGDLRIENNGGVAFHIRFKNIEYAARI